MIIATMTDEEMILEMNKDLPEVQARLMSREKEFRRLIIKASSFPVSAQPIIVTTAKRNRWIVIFRAMSRRERKQISYTYTTYICTATFSNGIHAFSTSSTLSKDSAGIGLAVFPPHFFSRYRSRFDTRKSGVELIADYFRKNYSYSCAFQDSPVDGSLLLESRVYGTSQEGISFGMIKSGSATLFKTFITYDMMHEEQIPEFTQKEILRQREMLIYQASLSSNSPEIIPGEEVRLTLRQEKDLEEIILKIGLLINAFAANDKTHHHPYDLQLFLNGLMRLFFPYTHDDQANLSPEEETDYLRMIEEIEFSIKGMLIKMLENGVKPEVMTAKELKHFVHKVKKNLLKDSGNDVALLNENQEIFQLSSEINQVMIPVAL